MARRRISCPAWVGLDDLWLGDSFVSSFYKTEVGNSKEEVIDIMFFWLVLNALSDKNKRVLFIDVLWA